jgi:hypothetical protein
LPLDEYIRFSEYNSMLIYCVTIPARLKYISDFIGIELTGTAIELTTDVEVYKKSAACKINYSKEPLAENEFWIQPHVLLSEKGIQPQRIECFETNGYKAFFKTGGDLSFDVFAASFYLLSRYEEYLPHQKDMYGRYAHENSVAFKEEFLNQPLINCWIELFKKSLKIKYPNFNPKTSNFKFLPTYDIDEAYSYKHKSWWRTAGASVKDILKGRWNKLSERRKVLNQQLTDPFDAYDRMDELHQTYELKPRYFFLVSEKIGKYDRNILPSETAMQLLIKRHANKYPIGVHPSWQSGDDASLIKKEIETIENCTQKKITASRQHFIRLTLPQTYRQLIAAGISEDFSMGYGSINGFRASVASSFYWYDLEKEETSQLLLHPFCYMEANSFYEQKITPEKALEEMLHYYAVVKNVNGTFVNIWHNTFLGTDPRFKGWREVYELFLKEISN